MKAVTNFGLSMGSSPWPINYWQYISYVSEMLALTTELSGTSLKKETYCHIILEVWSEHAQALR